MKRAILALCLSSMAFAVGCMTCNLQARNFHRGAELGRKQVQVDWLERRISGLRCQLSESEWLETSADVVARYGLQLEGGGSGAE